MRWAIEIKKTSLQQRNLADLLQGIGFKLVDGVEYPALHSTDIDTCEKAEDAFGIAKFVCKTFKVVTRIDMDFDLGSVIDFSTTPPRRHAFLAVTDIAGTSDSRGIHITACPQDLTPDELEKWKADYKEREYQEKLERQREIFEPAFIDLNAAKVIELLSIVNPTGVILYKIYEIAEGRASNRETFHAEYGISRDSFNRFRDTVHNPSESGDWARHGVQQKPLRSINPMSKNEAEAFVRKIAYDWLNSIRERKTHDKTQQ